MSDRSSYFGAMTGPPPGAESAPPTHDRKSSAAVEEAAQRDMALVRAMNPPPRSGPTRPPVKEAELPADFAAAGAKLDREVGERGVSVDRQKLLEIGQARFVALLDADRQAREEARVFGPRTDFSRWASVQFAFAQVGGLETFIPAQRTSEAFAGAGRDRESVRAIASFSDL